MIIIIIIIIMIIILIILLIIVIIIIIALPASSCLRFFYEHAVALPTPALLRMWSMAAPWP